MDLYTKNALWAYWMRGDNEVSNEEVLDLNNDDEHLQDYWWKVNNHECSPFTNWRDHIHGPYTNYYSNAHKEEEQEDEERCELFDDPTHEPPIFKIRRCMSRLPGDLLQHGRRIVADKGGIEEPEEKSNFKTSLKRKVLPERQCFLIRRIQDLAGKKLTMLVEYP
nr:hypothetical protein [Tanacetum cinerariifolium]